jgi:hypothetical protein
MNKIETIPIGKTLYHGTKFKLKNGFPDKKDGNWFATDPKQSILHVSSIGSSYKDHMYFYIYKTLKPIKVLKFDSGKNINNWAVREGFNLPANGSFAFSGADYNLAKHLCKNGKYDGWWFPNDQTQIMLCDPKSLLKFVKVMEITFPYGKPAIKFESINNKGEYIIGKNGHRYKYKLSDLKLDNLVNITNVPRNFVYSSRKDGKNVYFNHSGNPITISLNNKTPIKINGIEYFLSGTSGPINKIYSNTLKKRILNKTGETMNNFRQNKLWTGNQRDEYLKKMRNRSVYLKERRRRIIEGLNTSNLIDPFNKPKNNILPTPPEPTKSFNNININSSRLFIKN